METYDLVESWLDNVAFSHSINKGTPYRYRYGLTAFCKFVNATPEQVKAEYDRLDEKVYKRKYSEYVRAFISYLSKQNLAPNSVNTFIVAVKSFFKYNELPLGNIQLARKQTLYHNRDITKEEVKAMLDISPPRDKAFFCIMAQSGLRPETLCRLKIRQLEPDFSNGVIPCKIEVPQNLAKGKYKAYFTFIGEESVNYLKLYLSTRTNASLDDYLFTNMGTSEPANPRSLSKIFMQRIRKLREKGIVNYELRNGKPAELHLYNLRKFFSKFSSQMGFEEKEFLMGHTQGVRDHYLAQDPEHYRQLYREKAMPFLRFETATPGEFEKAITERDQEIATLKHDVEELRELVKKQTETMQRLIDKTK